MDTLRLSERIDSHFSLPLGSRGFKPSEFVQTFILMQHEGSFHLDDVRFLSEDSALRAVLDLKNVPQASALGAWLRKMGNRKGSFSALVEVNKVLLKSALHKHCIGDYEKAFTLVIQRKRIKG